MVGTVLRACCEHLAGPGAGTTSIVFVIPGPGNMSVFYLLLCFQDIMLDIFTLLMHTTVSAGFARSRCRLWLGS